jgi:hypothetical protein
MANTSAYVRRQGESPGNQIMLLNSVLAELAAQGFNARERTNPVEGFTSRTEHCWVVFADSEKRSQVAKAPVGAPSGLRLRGKEP